MFLEWSKEYGDIFSLKTLNRTVVIISSAAAVENIFSIPMAPVLEIVLVLYLFSGLPRAIL